MLFRSIGPIYTQQDAERLALRNKWAIAADGPPDKGGFRRVVASPRPLRVLNLQALTALVNSGALVIAAGGGGIPVVRDAANHTLAGVEAVIDKDLTAGLLAVALKVDCLLIATDVEAVFEWG